MNSSISVAVHRLGHRGDPGDGGLIPALGVGTFQGDVPGAAVAVGGDGERDDRRRGTGRTTGTGRRSRPASSRMLAAFVSSRPSRIGRLVSSRSQPAAGHGVAVAIDGRVVRIGDDCTEAVEVQVLAGLEVGSAGSARRDGRAGGPRRSRRRRPSRRGRDWRARRGSRASRRCICRRLHVPAQPVR